MTKNTIVSQGLEDKLMQEIISQIREPLTKPLHSEIKNLEQQICELQTKQEQIYDFLCELTHKTIAIRESILDMHLKQMGSFKKT